MATTWECPRCHRRVPLRAAECHCGTPRPAAGTIRPFGSDISKGSARDLPWQVWAWLGVLVLATLFGIYRLIRPGRPDPIVPILGHVDQRPASPPPKTQPTPRAK